MWSIFSTGVPPDAERVEEGWTVEHPDGTRGLGRPPFKTQEEAQDWCDKNPHFPGMSQG